jgi:hypothetical protein
MQKTEVFDIINIFKGCFWPILAISGPKNRGQFLWADFWPKTDWGHTLGKV